jgi:hypothetical protein
LGDRFLSELSTEKFLGEIELDEDTLPRVEFKGAADSRRVNERSMPRSSGKTTLNILLGRKKVIKESKRNQLAAKLCNRNNLY